MQGIQSKDRSFKPSIHTVFDPNLTQVQVAPQEIGRVLINLYDNAFYTTNEKRKLLGTQYDPEIKLTTRQLANKVQIVIEDNGQGVPPEIVNKIFQPFFTTKPTGQGTGLGLSLSYDIITKGHQGELSVESKQGEGSKFIITLPA